MKKKGMNANIVGEGGDMTRKEEVEGKERGKKERGRKVEV